MAYDTHETKTADGSIFHLEMSARDFLSVDPRGDIDVFSWTARCSADEFLDLGKRMPGVAMVAVGDDRHEGPTEDTIRWAKKFPADYLDEYCDFIRFQRDGSSVAFQVFPPIESFGRVTLVAISGRQMYLRHINSWIQKTATPRVVEEVNAVLGEMS
ncbi:hypothetical protein ACFV7R_10175 [Streptomyces sp. NPDC059866]|uniref:hypothetical protein n=1 Tax=Streptomyces sp. NPDC059866 TaxID=3346978 RepID=UPI00364B0368